jgi:alkaline phosphatase
MKKSFYCITMCIMIVFIGAGNIVAAGQSEAQKAATSTPMSSGTAKYVFLFIGDGMAMAQINSAEIYTTAVSSKDINIKKLGFTQFPVQGLTTTYDAGTFITDSASAATAIATGHKTLSGIVNMDPTKTIWYKTIAEYAHDSGKKVGIVSSVSLDHATPACFYAKAPSRGNMYDIAMQIPVSNFEFFGGGGFVEPKGKSKDKTSIYDLFKDNGYTVVNDPAAFKSLKAGASKIIAVNNVLQDSNAMPYDNDRAANDLSLSDYTSKAIELLDNPKGFFIMVEGGKVDWACHANDAASSISDVLAFDKAVSEAVSFAKKHPAETLIIVTGDHETGGMSIGFAGTQYTTFFDRIANQKGSYVKFNSTILEPYKSTHTFANAKLADILAEVEKFFGIKYSELSDAEKDLLERSFIRSMKGDVEKVKQEDIYLLYGGYEPLTVTLTHMVNSRAGIGWTTYSHTGVPVSTFASGAGQDLFYGYYDNTDLFGKLMGVMGLQQIAMN